MISVPAHKVRQFGVEFYQTSFTSRDIQKLVKFEVLNYPAVGEEEKRRKIGETSTIKTPTLNRVIHDDKKGTRVTRFGIDILNREENI